MAAVYSLGMQPVVRPAGKLCRQLVILDIAAPDQHLETRVRHKTQRRLRSPLLRTRALLPAQIAGLGQLPPDIGEVLLALGSLQLVEHAVEIVQLLLALFDEDAQILPCTLELAVLLIQRRRVLLRRFQRVESDADLRAVGLVIILADKAAVTAADAVEIGRHELCPAPDLLARLRFPVVLPLPGELAGQTVARALHAALQLTPAAPLLLLLIPTGIERVEQLGKAFAELRLRRFSVLRDPKEAEVKRLAVSVDQAGRVFPVLHSFRERVQLHGEQFVISAAAVTQFAADQRREAGEAVQQPLVHRGAAIGAGNQDPP